MGKKRGSARRFTVGVTILLATASTYAYAQGQVDPDAVQILKRTTEYLAGLQQFSVSTQVVIEDVHASGHRVDYDVSGSVTIKRPDKMYLERSGEMNQRFFYDGKTISLYSPKENVYATRSAPDTLEDMIALVREHIGIVLPAADLLYRNAFSLMRQDMSLATVVDKTVINGVKCDHLLFSRPGADFQLWVQEGKEPLPVKYVVTETDTPLKLSVSTTFTDWNLNPDVRDSQFKFVSPKGAKAIEFAPGIGAFAGRERHGASRP